MKDLFKFDWPEEELSKTPLSFSILYVKELGADLVKSNQYIISSLDAKIIPTFGALKSISRIELDLGDVEK